jgi:hypothetical protein
MKSQIEVGRDLQMTHAVAHPHLEQFEARGLEDVCTCGLPRYVFVVSHSQLPLFGLHQAKHLQALFQRESHNRRSDVFHLL